MDLYDMRREINEARQTLNNADEVACQIGYVLEDRLRQLPIGTLQKMKKELHNFDARTGVWK